MTASYVDAVYAAAQEAGRDWADGDVPPLPDWGPFLLRFKRPSVEVVSPPSAPRASPPPQEGPPAKRPRRGSPAAGSEPRSREGGSRAGMSRPDEDEEDRDEDEDEEKAQTADERDEAALVGPRVGDADDVAPYPADIDLGSIPRMAVLRPSPLVCVNQDIVSPHLLAPWLPSLLRSLG